MTTSMIAANAAVTAANAANMSNGGGNIDMGPVAIAMFAMCLASAFMILASFCGALFCMEILKSHESYLIQRRFEKAGVICICSACLFLGLWVVCLIGGW